MRIGYVGDRDHDGTSVDAPRTAEGTRPALSATVGPWSSVSPLDVLLLVLLVASLIVGYRRGALLQVLAYAGLAAGLIAGALAAPRVAALVSGALPRAAAALATLLVGGAIGDAVGWAVGSRVRSRARATRLGRADALGGSILSVLATLLATWFLALNLASGPSPSLTRAIRDSAIVRGIAAVMPPPPSLIGEVRAVLNLLGSPDVFAGLPPEPAAPVPAPARGVAGRAAKAGGPSTVQVLGTGCGGTIEGSGFVVSADLIVTNAHVVAGTSPVVRLGERQLDATPVLFDPEVDLAVLRVDGLDAPALPLELDLAPRGTGGAVLGYPGGGSLTARGAAVRRALPAVGRDIYGSGRIRRELYELQTVVRPGNSGGPFVLGDGDAAGVVFAASTTDERLGYAIASTELRPLLREAERRATEVATGRCVA